MVALLGPRQSGKTTLARAIARTGPFACDERLNYFDLEDPVHLDRLATPRLALDSLRGLIVIDEIQRRPDLFPVLRVLADREGTDARLLILGSASRDLIRQGSETLAGRIRFVDVLPFALTETGTAAEDTLWLRGGFPRSFLAESDVASWQWREDYIRTFLERDVPALGIRVQVRARRVLFRDSGIYHRLLVIPDRQVLYTHPKLGPSWEGMAIEQLIRASGASDEEVYFWGVHGQADIDLLVFRGGARLGYEVKFTDRPGTTRSQHLALEHLRLERLTVVTPGDADYLLTDRIRVQGLAMAVASF